MDRHFMQSKVGYLFSGLWEEGKKGRVRKKKDSEREAEREIERGERERERASQREIERGREKKEGGEEKSHGSNYLFGREMKGKSSCWKQKEYLLALGDRGGTGWDFSLKKTGQTITLCF